MTDFSTISRLRKCYLLLAVMGVVVRCGYFYLWLMKADGANLIEALRVNFITRGMTVELLLAAAALFVWVVAETSIRRNWSAYWTLPVTAIFGVGAGLPLYLFLRTRPV